ncbi:serine/threonine protein kinase [Pseudodonghicola xiamenensis]|uniref:Serine/threonine protein kinase n=1 Tax=Pseudodonghicola xiamenensis TaxID=337702 RepID=A0A8J3HBA5_9RHOB|nr:serine/threonine-protein kinase [Pseudodonghicola xiamenensis]GHG98459.1 serine/threonine protein kinase [Pseudodonghicola xiamenensis]
MSENLAAGTMIGGFVLGEAIGQGGFGITYLATLPGRSGRFAIKEYFPSDTARRIAGGGVAALPTPAARRLFDMGLRAFLEEAYILRDLPRQPGLVRVRSAFEKHGTAYCVMDFVGGDPLDRVVARLIRARGHIPEPLILDLIATLCRALGAVHAAGFLHRDIKPANVMIDPRGMPVLIDFGAARARGDTGRGAGSMLSRTYAAPEQFPVSLRRRFVGLKEGPWTDLYALSVMIYEIITRAAPPNALVRMQAMAETRADPYVPIRSALKRNRVAVGYSDRLLELIDCGCALWPAERPQSARAYRQWLEGMTAGAVGRFSLSEDGPSADGLSADGPSVAPVLPPPAVKRSGGDPRVVLVVGLILGLALFSAALALFPESAAR